MKEYDVYLFDADGTILDTAELIYQCFLHTCWRFGSISVDRNVVFKNMGLPLRPQLEAILGPLSDELSAEVCKAHMEYQLSIYPRFLKAFPLVKETLQELKNFNKKLGIVTSRRLDSLTLYLNQCQIYSYFDVLITPELTTLHKPHPEPALKACELLQGAPEKCLFIGDALFDISCGIAASMDTAFVLWSMIQPETLTQKPTYLIQSMHELIVMTD